MNVDNINKHTLHNSHISEIIIKKSVTSTNTLLKDMANKGASAGTVLIAEEQTAGRGRLGRSFYSPYNSGIYLSILLRPTMSANESLFLTTSAAVAVAKSIEKICGRRADIKWVNDIYIDGKKICGILTEGAINADGFLDYAIVGIGINIYKPKEDFPENIRDIAGAIFSTAHKVCETYDLTTEYTNIAPYITDNHIHTKELLIAEILNCFTQYYENFSQKTFLEEYRQRSFLIGKKIDILEGSSRTSAIALDIDDECHLIVQLENGEIRTLSSGEVSIKLH